MPENQPLVTEYQRHRWECPCCCERTCAELPVGVPSEQTGPRRVAFTVLLMVYTRQSKSSTTSVPDDVAGRAVLSGADGEVAQDRDGVDAVG